MALNSNQYSWNDITVVLGGRILYTLNGIEVEYGYEHEEVRGKGPKALAINEKNFSVSGTIKILQSDLEAMINTYGLDYQFTYFDVIWNFTPKNGQLRTHVIKGAKFGKQKMGMDQGDAFMEVELPFMALDFKPAV